MSSPLHTRWSWRTLGRQMAPWTVGALVLALLASTLPSAFAQAGASAAEAFQIAPDGNFSGTVAANSSVWFHFYYTGNNATATLTASFQPGDASRELLTVFTGDVTDPRPESAPSTLSGGVRTVTFSDPNARDAYLMIQNTDTGRGFSFIGNVSPAGAVATPTAATATPTPISTPSSPTTALGLAAGGTFTGLVSPHQALWYKVYDGAPGATVNVSASFSPAGDKAQLNIYTGADPTTLTQASGAASLAGTTLSRLANLPTAQYFYFTIVNDNDGTTLAYSGSVTPFTPAPTPTATATAAPSVTATPAATATATPAPSPTAQPVPAEAHDARYFSQTQFRIDNDTILGYFQSRGGQATFGYPVSRTFNFLGCPVQMFQGFIIQVCSGQGPTLINLLDPDIFPYTHVNGSVFPAPDAGLKNSTPAVTDPKYGSTILPFIQSNTPDTFSGQPVNFQQTFLSRGGLEIWGAPISQPQPDPTNGGFIYQRFQRGIMHYRQGQGTDRVLLADYLKSIIVNKNLPGDLANDAKSSRFSAQYCPGNAQWLCRASDLPGTDLTFAFEQG